MADHLLDFVINNLSKKSESEISGIVLGISRLMELQFIEGGSDVFDEMDDWLFENTDHRENSSSRLSEKILTGLYLLSRIKTCNQKDTSLWKERMKTYFQTIYRIFFKRYFRLSFPICNCNDLSILLFLCSHFQKDNYFKDEIELLHKELSQIIQIAFLERKSNSQAYFLNLLMEKTSMELPGLFSPDSWKFATLSDVNDFYLYRFVLGLDVPAPTVIKETLISIVHNERRMSELLSLLNPNNAGLNNYVGGLAWALLQWNMENVDVKKIE
jgi:hypothetical protein